MRWKFWIPKRQSLTFYMKSGNKFTLNNIEAWTITPSSTGSISDLRLEQNDKKTRLIVQSIDLSNIEAIVEHV